MLPEEEIAEALAFQFQPLSGSWMARDVEYTFKRSGWESGEDFQAA